MVGIDPPKNPVQLEHLTVTDSEKRIFESIVSAGIVDNKGNVVTPADIKAMLPTYMARGGPIIDSHSNRPVGKILDYWDELVTVTPDLVAQAANANPGNPAVMQVLSKYIGKTVPVVVVQGQIFKDYPGDDEVWEGIKSGRLRGMSAGTNAPIAGYSEEHGGFLRAVRALWEFSVVEAPAVALALITGVNELAQSDETAQLLQSAARDPHAARTDDDEKQEDAPMTTSTPGAHQAALSDKSLKKNKEEVTMADEKLIPTPSTNASASEDRSEAPAAVTLEALAAKLDDNTKRLDAIESSLKPKEEAAPSDSPADDAEQSDGDESTKDVADPAEEEPKQADSEEEPKDDKEPDGDEDGKKPSDGDGDAPSDKKDEEKQSAACDTQTTGEMVQEHYPWDQCIRDQKAKGMSDEDAAKVCGSIKAKSNQADEAGVTDAAKGDAPKQEESKQADKVRITSEQSNTRGNEELKQAGTPANSGVSAYEIASGAVKVSWAELHRMNVA